MNSFADLDRKKRIVMALRRWARELVLQGPTQEDKSRQRLAHLAALARDVGRGTWTVERWLEGRSRPPATIHDQLEAALRKRGVAV